ncbi:MAG: acyl-CoA dehydratase activase [Candidatus Hodarchaeales archaeon]|jgi:predicted CoA-substrate-specific enzyme activase
MVNVIGIDVGSLTAKIVLLQVNEGVIKQEFSELKKVGYSPKNVASSLISRAKNRINDQQIDFIVSTGYGRKLVEESDKSITEITCHATGAFFTDSKIRTIIDIGGQDSKVITVNNKGRVQDFEMNDKCSAGSGRFLEVIASALEVSIEDFGVLGLRSKNPSIISNTCTVFAESEVISRINQGAERIDIIAGIHEAIVNKTIALSARVGVRSRVSLTGGVALNPSVKILLEKGLNMNVTVPKYPQMNGALGAALLANKFFHGDN